MNFNNTTLFDNTQFILSIDHFTRSLMDTNRLFFKSHSPSQLTDSSVEFLFGNDRFSAEKLQKDSVSFGLPH
jgi:hypothetical protein